MACKYENAKVQEPKSCSFAYENTIPLHAAEMWMCPRDVNKDNPSVSSSLALIGLPALVSHNSPLHSQDNHQEYHLPKIYQVNLQMMYFCSLSKQPDPKAWSWKQWKKLWPSPFNLISRHICKSVAAGHNILIQLPWWNAIHWDITWENAIYCKELLQLLRICYMTQTCCKYVIIVTLKWPWISCMITQCGITP